MRVWETEVIIIAKMPFIEINGRIHDYNEYKKDCRILKRLVKEDIEAVLRQYGFEKDYNSLYDLKVVFRIESANKAKVKLD